jgi:iron complex outermembrane recepter protein
MRLRTLLLAATACGSALIPEFAKAQAQPAQNMLSEIIVTARKRQESILNVPVVEVALPQAQLERLQFQDLRNLNARVPGLQIGESNLSVGTQVSLRGIGTNTLNAGVDQSVSLNLDGLQLTQGLAYGSAMFDVGQVEVLKGPQALFYGKNSPGGVISVRTADPTDAFELIGRYGHEFEARENRGELIFSGPVNDQLRLRLATLWYQSDGFFFNKGFATPGLGGQTPLSSREPNDKGYVVRGTAIWRPMEVFDARVKINLTHDRQDEAGKEQFVSCPEGAVAVPGFGIPFLGNGEDCKQDRIVRVIDMDPRYYPGIPNNGIPYADTTQQFGTVELNWRPSPDVTITSTTGYYDVRNSGLINAQFSTAAGPTFAASNRYSRHDFTQELRLNTEFDGAWNVTAGGFMQDAEVRNRTAIGSNTAIGLPPLLLDGSHKLQIKSYSAFGQARWEVIPTLEVALGARWTHERRSDEAFNFFGAFVGPVPLANPSISSDNLSPELTLTYTPTDNITVFGSLKKGFKSGSFDITTFVLPDQDNSFGDERVKGGEIGLKSRWFDRRLSLDLAFYDYRYEGLQVGVSRSVEAGGIPFVQTLNAGSARVYGVDFDAAYRPEQIEGLELHTYVEWNQARFKSLDGVPCWGGMLVSEGCNQVFDPTLNGGLGGFTGSSMSGYPLQRAPDWQVSFGLSYERPLPNGMSIVLANENQYSSKYLTVLGASREDFYQKEFFKTDVNLSLRGKDERWELALIGKNLGNELTRDNCSAFNQQNSFLGGQITGSPTTGSDRGPAGQDEVACFLSRGREVWVRMTYRPFS